MSAEGDYRVAASLSHPATVNGCANSLASSVSAKPQMGNRRWCRDYRNKTSPSSVEAFRLPSLSNQCEKQVGWGASMDLRGDAGVDVLTA